MHLALQTDPQDAVFFLHGLVGMAHTVALTSVVSTKSRLGETGPQDDPGPQ
jgi:hypothetical protein